MLEDAKVNEADNFVPEDNKKLKAEPPKRCPCGLPLKKCIKYELGMYAYDADGNWVRLP